MKKVIIVYILLIAFLFSSCVDSNIQLPEGVWISKEPNLILYMDQLYRSHGSEFRVSDSEIGRFLGIYTVDDEEVKVFTNRTRGQGFQIQPITAIDVQSGAINGDAVFFTGRYRVEGDRMYFTLVPGSQRRTGLTEIIFYRVEDPEWVHPLEWAIPPRD